MHAPDIERLRQAAALLAAAGIEDPLREARILLKAVPERFDEAIARRTRHEPVAYILGRREFWSLDFEVSPAVLIPRPDTETLVEAVLKELKQSPPQRILDLGTGSGCILLSLLTEFPQATGVGVDLSPAALEVAQRNARSLGVSERARFIQADFAAFDGGFFDLVVSNPPYIEPSVIASLDPDVRDHEPHLALDGGANGLEAIGRIAKRLPSLLAPSAPAFVEIGYDQGESAAQTLRNAGLEVIRIVKDLGGQDRVIMARCPL
jgi:release factor glutamine methyltransferase